MQRERLVRTGIRESCILEQPLPLHFNPALPQRRPQPVKQ